MQVRVLWQVPQTDDQVPGHLSVLSDAEQVQGSMSKGGEWRTDQVPWVAWHPGAGVGRELWRVLKVLGKNI